ncbi:hypothetical protein QF027_000469 [Streptomyces canus]|nr:hypothetical protein [Streptomyces canus]
MHRPRSQDEVLSYFAEQARAATDGGRVAIGRPQSGPGGVVQSYEEALNALGLAERTAPSHAPVATTDPAAEHLQLIRPDACRAGRRGTVTPAWDREEMDKRRAVDARSGGMPCRPADGGARTAAGLVPADRDSHRAP